MRHTDIIQIIGVHSNHSNHISNNKVNTYDYYESENSYIQWTNGKGVNLWAGNNSIGGRPCIYSNFDPFDIITINI